MGRGEMGARKTVGKKKIEVERKETVRSREGKKWKEKDLFINMCQWVHTFRLFKVLVCFINILLTYYIKLQWA